MIDSTGVAGIEQDHDAVCACLQECVAEPGEGDCGGGGIAGIEVFGEEPWFGLIVCVSEQAGVE